ncbi:nucleoside 2-deoxyribosyltransferase [candidate division KSB1 bacterium]|nr:nucleoside 2-deoxyribosyltransferase [candidate division KSB1 bacterium]
MKSNFQHKPDFEALKQTLLGGDAGRVPLLELAIDNGIKAKILGRAIQGPQDLVDFFAKAGYDYVRLTPKIDMNPGKAIPGEGYRRSVLAGDTEERSWHSTGKGMITTLADFEAFQFPRPEDIDYSAFEDVQNALPEGMKIIAQYGDIFTWTWHFMGFETFSYALVENPELVQRVFDAIGSIEMKLFETMADFDNVGAIFYSDDIAYHSGLMVSPVVFQSDLFPWMKKIGDLCKRKQIPFIYHTDGRIWEVMDDLKRCGVDALQPLEPQAIDIREVKRRYGDKFCLAGNIDVDILSRGTPKQIEAIARGLIEEIGRGGGYCLGSGNTVPNYVPVENYLAMIQAAF